MCPSTRFIYFTLLESKTVDHATRNVCVRYGWLETTVATRRLVAIEILDFYPLASHGEGHQKLSGLHFFLTLTDWQSVLKYRIDRSDQTILLNRSIETNLIPKGCWQCGVRLSHRQLAIPSHFCSENSYRCCSHFEIVPTTFRFQPIVVPIAHCEPQDPRHVSSVHGIRLTTDRFRVDTVASLGLQTIVDSPSPRPNPITPKWRQFSMPTRQPISGRWDWR